MLDPKFIRSNVSAVREAIALKHEAVDLDLYLRKDDQRRDLLRKVETLKAERNTLSDEVASLRKRGQDGGERMIRMREVSAQIKEMDPRLRVLDEEIQGLLYRIPNIPHPSVPRGEAAEANLVVREWGERRPFSFKPLAHWDLGQALGILDFPRAAKIAGAHFALYKGLGARLERGLINFMLDLHVREQQYTEVLPPFLANRAGMLSTGQLPKLEGDMYLCTEDDLFLNPTGEVPITNLHRDETLPPEVLPLNYTAYTACFRREAGSYGKETKGLLRVHQFNKVEMVKFVTPESSYDELEILLSNAEAVLQRLNLLYRVVVLSTGDLSFASAKTYDLEVWAPGVEKYLEVSSVSNFEDFQARRAGIKFRRPGGGPPEFVHTLNGSGLATARTFAAILENYQNEDGSVTVPEALRPYMDGIERITRP
jgi:seryl-tRNA synthetase